VAIEMFPGKNLSRVCPEHIGLVTEVKAPRIFFEPLIAPLTQHPRENVVYEVVHGPVIQEGYVKLKGFTGLWPTHHFEVVSFRGGEKRTDLLK
jgi:hypothetical protein